MTNTSATLLEKNVEQAFQAFEALLDSEGTEKLRAEWSKIKKALSVSDAPSQSDPADPAIGDLGKGGPDGANCQGTGCP